MKLRVLIIDDEECIRDSMEIYLREKGYEVETANDPSVCIGVENGLCEGIDSCADVVIVDQWMPVLTGIDFLSQRHERGCKSAGQHKALMSANLSGDLREQAIQLGCKVFEKPVRLSEIEEWLAEVAGSP